MIFSYVVIMRQKRILVFIAIAALMATVCVDSANAQQSRQQRLRQHLYLLASDSLQGRLAGSVGGAKARQYILNQYQTIGLQPYGDSCLYPFRPRLSQVMPVGFDTGMISNIIMMIPGNDPVLKDEYIVLGAHYDHIGVKNGQVHNGADDNASGSTALIEIARELYAKRNELKRSIIIAAFDSEEQGLYGSKDMVRMMGDDIHKVKVMMSIDMVGWLSTNNALEIEGVATLAGADKTMRQIADEQGMTLKLKRFETSALTATDTEPFASIGQLPTLAVTTGLKSPYHKPEDDADLIDYEGLDRICSFLTELTLQWATDRAPLKASGKVAPKHREHLPMFEIGPAAGFGTASLRYPNSSLKGRLGLECHTGLDTRLNFGSFTLQGQALFNAAMMPNVDLSGTAADIFGHNSSETQTSLLIPVSAIWNATPEGDVYLGAGINYRRLLNHTATYNADLWGVHWTFGFRLGRTTIAYMMLYQGTSYLDPDAYGFRMKSMQRWITVSFLL